MESVSHASENLANAAIADRDSTAILISANKELTESNKLLVEQGGTLDHPENIIDAIKHTYQ
eukprot:12116341-Ditylum_brightwellii.AAC.1